MLAPMRTPRHVALFACAAAIACGEPATLAPAAPAPTPDPPPVWVEQLGLSGELRHARWLPGERLVALVDDTERAIVWDVETGRIVEARRDVTVSTYGGLEVDASGRRARFGVDALSLDDGRWSRIYDSLPAFAAVAPGFDRLAWLEADGVVLDRGAAPRVRIASPRAEITYARDGTRFALCTTSDVRLFDADGAELGRWTFPPEGAGSELTQRCSFSPSGAYLVAGQRRPWPAVANRVVLAVPSLSVAVPVEDATEALAVSPDDARYALLSVLPEERVLVIRELSTGAELHRETLPRSVRDVAFVSADLLALASSPYGDELGGGVYSIAEGRFLHRAAFPSAERVASDGRVVTADPSGAIVLLGSDGAVLRRLDLPTEAPLSAPGPDTLVVEGTVTTFLDRSLGARSAAGCGGANPVVGHRRFFRALDGEGDVVAVAAGCIARGSVVTTTDRFVPYRLSADGASFVAFDPDTTELEVWSTRDARLRAALGEGDDRPTCRRLAACGMPVEISPDGRFVAVAHDDDLSLFDAATGARLGHRRVPDRTASMTFSPDGSHLLHVATGERARVLLRTPALELVDARAGERAARLLTSDVLYEEGPVRRTITLGTGAVDEAPLAFPAAELALDGDRLLRVLGDRIEVLAWPGRTSIASVPGRLLEAREGTLLVCREGRVVVATLEGEARTTALDCDGERHLFGPGAVLALRDRTWILHRVSDGAELAVRGMATATSSTLLFRDALGPLDDSASAYLRRGPAVDPDGLATARARGLDARTWLAR